MHINIKIPDWAGQQKLYILSGIDLVAYKSTEDDSWSVKSQQCSGCGICCKEQNCNHLFIEEYSKLYRCKLGLARPFHCCVWAGDKNCTQKFEKDPCK